MDIRVIEYGSREQIQSIALRYEVLRKPLELKFHPKELTLESDQIHIAAFSGQKVVGILLLVKYNPGVLKMRQVAVDNAVQGSGIGKKMVNFSENWAIENAFSKIELHARESAITFYKKLGYQVVGEFFTEVGIPHVKMVKNL